ncbi:hypothetical protein TNCV_2735061 [Trichonephila clavipes]|nr:hypothetical protein TNCV_2735061 [Trichonephila clavipes]
MKERPVSEITPRRGRREGRKRPNEDETRERHEGENGRAQEGGGGLNSPKTRSRSTKNAVGRKMLLFFAARMKKKESARELTDDTAGVTKLEPALRGLGTPKITDLSFFYFHLILFFAFLSFD